MINAKDMTFQQRGLNLEFPLNTGMEIIYVVSVLICRDCVFSFQALDVDINLYAEVY